MRQDRQLCSLLILILLLCARQFRRHKSRLGCRLNAGVAQWAERHGCRESAARTWMSVRRVPTERRRSEGTRRSRAQPGARTLGYLVSFQVTRRRRNRSGVSQSPISRAAITWRIQISSCTRNPVGDAGALHPGPRSDDRGRSGGSSATDKPLSLPSWPPASPTGNASRQTAVFAVDLDLASMCASVQTTQIATWVQAERRWRAVGRAAWMPRERRKDMDVRSARAHGASPK
jgi:hypothetical protein